MSLTVNAGSCSAPLQLPTSSPIELQSQLDLAAVACGAVNLAEVGVGEVQRNKRIPEIRVIQEVKELPAKLKAGLFRNWKSLKN